MDIFNGQYDLAHTLRSHTQEISNQKQVYFIKTSNTNLVYTNLIYTNDRKYSNGHLGTPH